PVLEGAKQGVIVEPVCLSASELLERGAQVRARAIAEPLPGCFQQRVLEALDGLEIDRRRREGPAGAVLGVDQPVLDEPVRADEERVPRERRERLVGRIAVAGRTQRKRLPEDLAGLVQPIDPRQGRGTYVADPV